MEAAQMRPSPRSSGEGRLRASLAAILALRRAYSSSRCSVQNPSIHSSTGSTVARTALGMRNASACLVPELLARLLVTLSLLSVVAAPGQHEHADQESHQWDSILTDSWDPRYIAKNFIPPGRAGPAPGPWMLA